MTDDEIGDLFRTLHQPSIRRLFGGKGIYDGETIVAIVLRGTLYLKGDEESAPLLEAEGCERWHYQRPGRAVTAMPYWTAPDAMFDDPDEAARWTQIALGAGMRSGAAAGWKTKPRARKAASKT